MKAAKYVPLVCALGLLCVYVMRRGTPSLYQNCARSSITSVGMTSEFTGGSFLMSNVDGSLNMESKLNRTTHTITKQTTTQPKINVGKQTTAEPKTTSPVRVLLYCNGTWKREQFYCVNMPKYRIVTTNTKYGRTPIAIHEPRDDVHVSGSIARNGNWEGGLVNILMGILENNKDGQFIDLGANIGMYTLTAAKMGRKVVAIDPLRINILRLCTSLINGRIWENVTLVRNPLSNIYENVTMAKSPGNIGGTQVISNNYRKTLPARYDFFVQTAKLDDILSIPGFDFRTVVMKMDVESYEAKILQGSKKFFDKINVVAILMEWAAHRNINTGTEIINYMTKLSFQPFNPYDLRKPIPTSGFQNWPGDILWLKKQ